MSRIAVCTDSTSDIPTDLATELGIGIIPLKVIFGNETFIDRTELTASAFYARLNRSSVLPTTSQPSIGDFVQFFNRQAERADEILSIHISSALSGTLDSARAARLAIGRQTPIELLDSRSISMGLGLLAIKAARLTAAGMSLPEIIRRIQELIPRINVLFVLDTLEFLHRGGRIGGAQRFLGSLLNIKPILEVKDGRVEAVEQARTKARAMARLLELVEARTPPGKTLYGSVIHAAAPEEALELKGKLEQRLSCQDVCITEASPVIGVHTGPGALGVAFYAE